MSKDGMGGDGTPGEDGKKAPVPGGNQPGPARGTEGSDDK